MEKSAPYYYQKIIISRIRAAMTLPLEAARILRLLGTPRVSFRRMHVADECSFFLRDILLQRLCLRDFLRDAFGDLDV